jgi:TatD DNase family protein
MKFVDAHIHLSDEEYTGCTDRILQEAKNNNVVALVSNSMDLKTNMETLKLAKQHRGLVYAALGIHPWTVNTLSEDELQETSQLILKQKRNKTVIAIGEIGLDFKYMKIWNKQMTIFDSMLHLAEKLDLPVTVHSRGTTTQIIDMLPSYKIAKVLLHWFSNPISALPKALEKGYYISEGAPTLYSNGIRDIIKKVPLTNLLTETDGPVRFLKPPFNGKKTTPSLIPTVVKAIAEIKKLNPEAVANQIINNFEQFFEVNVS